MINKIETFIQKIVTPQMSLAVLSIYYFTNSPVANYEGELSTVPLASTTSWNAYKG